MEEIKKESCENDSVAEVTEDEQKSIDNSEYYGRYFTTQYEVLERMLSHLNINDLINASYVHSSWKHISERLLEKRRKLRWIVRKKDNILGHNSFKKNEINFQSEFALGFQLKRSQYHLLTELMKDDSYICSRTTKDVAKGLNIPGLWNSNMILIKAAHLEVPYYTKDNELKYIDDVDFGIMFPKMEGLEIITIPVCSDDLNFEFNSPSLKGILTFHREGEFGVMETAFNKLLNSSSTPVALAGGIFSSIKMFCRKKISLRSSRDIVNVHFCGENVSCYSTVLSTNREHEVEKFMIHMKEELGPFDAKKQRRIAIVIRCVARTNDRHEKALYKKHFPDVAAFTVLSNGECGYHTLKENEDVSKEKRTRRHVTITYCYSVVFFFITINLPT